MKSGYEKIIEDLKRTGTSKIPIVPQRIGEDSFADYILNMPEEALRKEKDLAIAADQMAEKVYNFGPKTKLADRVAAIKEGMGVTEPLDISYKYGPGGGVSFANLEKRMITLDPRTIKSYGNNTVLAHELRHLKETPLSDVLEGVIPKDSSVRTNFYSEPTGTAAFFQPHYQEEALKSLRGNKLSEFQKGLPRKAEAVVNHLPYGPDKILKNTPVYKDEADLLKLYDLVEKGHFKSSFLSENLRRLSKGLPFITALATLLEPDMASAAANTIVPGGVEELGDPMEKDPEKFREQQKREYFRKLGLE